jgi:NCS1 family nucleobase:cation symporter-1
VAETSYQDQVLEVEPFGVDKIPQEERHGRIKSIFTLWFASDLNVVTWFTGFLGIELGLSVKFAVIAIIIGNLLGGVFLGLASAVGPKLGRPLVPASERAFGKMGMKGFSFLNLFNNVGWLAVNLALSVLAFQKIIPALGYHPALIILAAATLLIAVYGYNFIHAFAYWMTIIMGVFFVAMTYISLHNLPVLLHSTKAVAAGGFSWGIFILAVSVAFSYQLSYCPIGSDYSRYLPEQTSKFKVWLATYGSVVMVTIWLEILGTLSAMVSTNADPMSVFSRLMGAFTIPAMIIVILSLMPINIMGVYSGGLALLAMGMPVKRWASAILVAVLGVLAISFGNGKLASTYQNFLLLLSYWIVPWLAVVLVDFFVNQVKGRVALWQGWPGIVSFVLGVAISIPFMSTVLYTGPLAKRWLGGADISYFLSTVVSVLVYLAIIKIKLANETANVNAVADGLGRSSHAAVGK